jgi:hypothetical protein
LNPGCANTCMTHAVHIIISTEVSMSQSSADFSNVILQNIEDLLPSWKEGTERRLDQLGQQFVAAYPEKGQLVANLLAKRKPAIALLDDAYREGAGSPKKSWSHLEEKAKELAVPGLFAKMNNAREKGQISRRKSNADRKLGSSGRPLSTVKPIAHIVAPVLPVAENAAVRRPPPPSYLVRNDIRSLDPHKHWTLLLDETGRDFDAEPSGSIGKFVGILVSTPHSGLPPIRSAWHAVDEDSSEIDRVFQLVLNAPCGVIGLPVSALPSAKGERWLDGMRALIDLVLRLMPVDGPTQLDVVIEARPPYRPGTEPDAIRRDALAMLARAWPERAAQLDLYISTQGKDGHALLPYVDALAYTWGSSRPSSKERLKLSGLVNTCLLNFSSTDLAACWDAWDQPGGLAPSYWVALVTSSEARDRASIASAILGSLAEVARQDRGRWQLYLAEAQRHLFGGSFRLEQVGAMVDWLQQAMPPEVSIPDPLRLVWLTVSLAHANHLGATEHAWVNDLARLSASLYEEAAPLRCHADLHLAVAMTNRFDFDGASRVLEFWRDKSPEISGLRYWGQCRSSMGQHCAFVCDQAGARRYFTEAVQAFSRLSDPVLRRKEIDQTSCYAAVVAMDDERLDDAEARSVLTQYLGDVQDAAARLAASNDSEQYRHHTLLRWMVARPDKALWNTYRGLRESWATGFGHPWPLIEMYRGILIHAEDPNGAIEQARTAAAIAFTAQQGPTVRLIGACCRAIGVAWGDSWPEHSSVISELRASLPYASAGIDQLELYLREPKQPLTLLREVLPFNFH